MSANAIHEYEAQIKRLKYWLEFNSAKAEEATRRVVILEQENSRLKGALDLMAQIYQGRTHYGGATYE